MSDEFDQELNPAFLEKLGSISEDEAEQRAKSGLRFERNQRAICKLGRAAGAAVDASRGGHHAA